MDVRSYMARQDTKWKDDNESGGNLKESPRETEVVWACDAKIGALCREEGDGNGSTREKEERSTT